MTEARTRSAAPELFAGVTTSQVVGGTLVVVAVVAAFWLTHRFAAAVFTLFAAMVLGTAVRPGLAWLLRRGVSRHLSAVVLYVALLGAGVSAAVLVVPVASSQAAEMAAKVPAYLAEVRSSLLTSPSMTVRRIALELPLVAPDDASAPTTVGDTRSDLERAAKFAFGMIAILLLGFYWTYEGDVTVRALLLFAPLEQGDRIRELIEAAEERVGGYVRGQLIVCAVTTALSLGAFVAIGLPNALVLALVAGAMGAVPVVGYVLGGAVALLGAASQPALLPWVIGAVGAIHLLQEYVVSPRVLGQRVGVHPFTILLAISGFGSLLGVAGAALAIPMAAIIQLLLDRFVFDTTNEHQPVAASARRDRRSVLSLEAQALALDARRQARSREEGANAQFDEAKNMVESIASDLDRILTARRPAAGAAP